MNYMPKEPPREMNREPSQLVKALAWLKNVALSNWPLKLLSLVLALVLWAGLITQDPDLTREKRFQDVHVTVNNEDILRVNGYIVISDLNALLSDVDLTVEVPQMQYAAAQASNYNVRVDLNRLQKSAGEQELNILTTSTSTYGKVTRVSPSTVKVMVEEYEIASFPVNVAQTGETPEGFYAVSVTRDPEWITVSGPRSLVDRVDRAEAVLDMSGLPAREGTVQRSLHFELLDAEGQVVSSEHLQVTRERINVGVTLYTSRDIALLTAQLYTGVPAEGYEVTDVHVTPSYVTVAGRQSVVETIDLLQTARLVNVNGAKGTVTSTVELAKPQNLQWISATRANVTVVIRPVQETASIADVPVTLQGLPEGWSAENAPETVQVRITGEAAWVNALTAADVQVVCDVSGLGEGTHDVTLRCEVAGGEEHPHVLETEPAALQVTLKAPAQ